MKKSIRKLLALACCLMIILSFSSVVSAATVTWSDSNGSYSVVTNIKAALDSRVERINGMPTLSHTQGTATAYPFGGPFTVSMSASYDRSAHGNSYLIQAMQQDGVRATYTYSGSVPGTTGNLGLPASAVTGTYALFMTFQTRSGSWYTVHSQLVGPTDVGTCSIPFAPESGKINYAPCGVGAVSPLRIS